MIKTFQEGKDIYATIASIAFNVPYEQCLEFHPETHEYQPDGKERRSVAKVLVLGRPSRLKTLAITNYLCPLNRSLTTILFRLLSENFVNHITHGCAAHV